MLYNVYFVATTQVLADIACFSFSLKAAKNSEYKKFFIINAIAFFILTIGDIYYNYFYRILNSNIQHSLNFVVTFSLLTFQISQAYNWFQLARIKKKNILSSSNFPYLLLTILLIAVFLYYFLTSQSQSTATTWNQSISVSLDMAVWFFAIICLAGSRSLSVTLLTFGCLILISGDLSSRFLFMLDANALKTVNWIHVVRSFGSVCMAIGFFAALKKKEFKFCPPNSIQEDCCAWLSISSIVVFMIGFLFLSEFSLTYKITDIRLTLWNLPIALVFTMVSAVLFGNKFSEILLVPITRILNRIETFNSEKEVKTEKSLSDVHEFKMLEDFVNTSFIKLSTQLDREIRLAAQVAHDIRSPLSALQIFTEQRLSELPESKRILLRDAVYQITDIVNNLDQNVFQKEKIPTQLVVLLEYVLSERRVAFSNKPIKINEAFPIESYSFFSNVVPSEIKRIITNIFNNAVDAIEDKKNGVINISIEKSDEVITISICDNGIGIPKEILNSLFTRGFTTKKLGSGLGLFHAKEALAKFNGSIEIISELDKETKVLLKIPSCDRPSWFLKTLKIPNNSILICVDDSISIWNAWQERLKSLSGNVELKYCCNKESLLQQLANSHDKPCSYLVDYEFSGEIYTGSDLIKKISSFKKPNDKIYLVTSRSNESDIQNFCLHENIPIIPKFFALKIPIEITQ